MGGRNVPVVIMSQQTGQNVSAASPVKKGADLPRPTISTRAVSFLLIRRRGRSISSIIRLMLIR
jgi:hypothetical protein